MSGAAPICKAPPFGYGTAVSVCVRGYHLPAIEDRIATERRRFGDVEVEVPRLDSGHLREAMTAARRDAAVHLRGRPLADILAVIERVAANWAQPDYPARQLAERVLPAVTGFSSATVRHGLPLLLGGLHGDALRRLLDAELGHADTVDRVHDGRRAVGPRLITHVLSGNIPGLAAVPTLTSLAVKSAVLLKAAAGDPVLPALFAASIAAADADVGRCVLATYWPGGDRSLEAVAFSEADLVVASGSEASIAAIAAQVPGRFSGHGHKVSFAVIGKERLSDADVAGRLADALAYDVSLWDQQGCLSPQLCYVERGGAIAPGDFADLLAEQLSRWAVRLPPRRLTVAEQSAVLRFRQEVEWRGAAGLLASTDSTTWTVSIEEDDDFTPTCLNRCVRVKIVPSLMALAAALAPHRRHLEAAGIAVGAERLSAVVEMLAACGVHRVCRIGVMQRPPLTWPQSGRPRVAEWLEWVGVEEGEG